MLGRGFVATRIAQRAAGSSAIVRNPSLRASALLLSTPRGGPQVNAGPCGLSSFASSFPQEQVVAKHKKRTNKSKQALKRKFGTDSLLIAPGEDDDGT